MFALHVDTTTFTDDTYEISQESAEDVSVDHVNVVARFSEGPNPGLEDLNFTNSNPPAKASPGYNPLL
jgi:hypothetical protein